MLYYRYMSNASTSNALSSLVSIKRNTYSNGRDTVIFCDTMSFDSSLELESGSRNGVITFLACLWKIMG